MQSIFILFALSYFLINYHQNFLTFWNKRVAHRDVLSNGARCQIRMPMVGFGLFLCEMPFGFHGLQFASKVEIVFLWLLQGIFYYKDIL